MIDGQRRTASPDPEVTPKAKRLIFAAAYKKKILAEADAAAGGRVVGGIEIGGAERERAVVDAFVSPPVACRRRRPKTLDTATAVHFDAAAGVVEDASRRGGGRVARVGADRGELVQDADSGFPARRCTFDLPEPGCRRIQRQMPADVRS